MELVYLWTARGHALTARGFCSGNLVSRGNTGCCGVPGVGIGRQSGSVAQWRSLATIKIDCM